MVRPVLPESRLSLYRSKKAIANLAIALYTFPDLIFSNSWFPIRMQIMGPNPNVLLFAVSFATLWISWRVQSQDLLWEISKYVCVGEQKNQISQRKIVLLRVLILRSPGKRSKKHQIRSQPYKTCQQQELHVQCILAFIPPQRPFYFYINSTPPKY